MNIFLDIRARETIQTVLGNSVHLSSFFVNIFLDIRARETIQTVLESTLNERTIIKTLI